VHSERLDGAGGVRPTRRSATRTPPPGTMKRSPSLPAGASSRRHAVANRQLAAVPRTPDRISPLNKADASSSSAKSSRANDRRVRVFRGQAHGHPRSEPLKCRRWQSSWRYPGSEHLSLPVTSKSASPNDPPDLASPPPILSWIDVFSVTLALCAGGAPAKRLEDSSHRLTRLPVGVLMPWSRSIFAPPPGPMFRLGVAVSIVAATASLILPARIMPTAESATGCCRCSRSVEPLPLVCVDPAIAPAGEARLARDHRGVG
jgi:hypothetical protein